MRHYVAYADNGRDFIHFEFSSEYRANSRANKEDAQKTYRLAHGYKSNTYIRIIHTYLGHL